jgi:4-amino-4-deoxy-L-arabinose transferase-like glycosyltransferase
MHFLSQLLKNHTSILTYLIVLSVVVRFFIELFVPFNYQDKGIAFSDIDFKKDYGKITPIDDPEIVETAIYAVRGMGFLTSRSFNRPTFRKDTLIKTAFRPKFSVYMHVVGISVYTKCHPSYNLAADTNMPPDYYYLYGLILLIIKLALFIPAIFSFYQLATKLTSASFALLLTLLFTLYPSMYYVGLLNVFEPIITFLTLLILNILCNKTQSKSNGSVSDYLIVVAGLVFCTWMKPHVLFYILFFLLIAIYQSVKQRIWSANLKMVSCAFVFVILGHVPIFMSNYNDFGKVFLANQAGIDFFHAHNRFARGSWTPELFAKHGDELMKDITKNKDLPNYNEKQEADYYQQLAVEWIKNHPLDELKLGIKKLLIFFLPHNFMSLKINLFTLLIHLGFLYYGWLFFVNKRFLITDDLYLVSVIVSVLILDTLYFVEYRWRFFADPEILLLAGIGLYDLVLRTKSKFPNLIH